MKKNAIKLMLVIILVKVTGLVRDLTLSYYYGASNISDIYLISTTIPSVLFLFISSGVYTGFIPIYNLVESDKNIKAANEYMNNLVNLVIIICTIIIIFCLIFTKDIVYIFASGFNEESLKTTIMLTRITMFSIYATGMISIFKGFLEIKEEYTIPVYMGVPKNLIIILAIALSYYKGIVLLAIGVLLANGSQIFMIIPYLKENKYDYRLKIDIKSKYIIKTIKLAIPVIIGVSVNQINILVDRTLASRIITGGISALNYANKLNLFIQGIFVFSIVTILYPKISKLALEGKYHQMKNIIRTSFIGVIMFLVPITVGSMIYSKEIIELLYKRGSFGDKDVLLTSAALFYYSIGLVGFGLRRILSRIFYAMQDTRTPMINASIGMLINIILNLIFSKYMGISGLALATSVSAIITTLLMFYSMRVKFDNLFTFDFIKSFFKILIISLLMGIISKGVYYYTLNEFGNNLSLILAVIIAMIVYFCLICIIHIPEVNSVIEEVKIRCNRYREKYKES